MTNEQRIFTQNLNELMRQKDVTQLEVANRIGVSPQTFNTWTQGKAIPRMGKIQALADYFNVKKSALLEDPGEYENIPSNIVKVLGSVPAGIPLEAIEDVVDYEEIPESWLNGDAQYFGLRVKGDSMYPKYMEGDTIICKKQTTCENGADAVVFVNGYDATLKKVIKSAENVILQPLNAQYETKVYSNNDIKVAGVVVELRRKI